MGAESQRSSVSASNYRRALRCWASGVTIVTVGDVDATWHGLTVSAFSSVSLDPPTILVCIDGRSRVHPYLQEQPFFAVNILSAGQRELSERFGRPRADRPLDRSARRGTILPCPVIAGVVAVLECVVAGSSAIGDHSIYFGRVVAAETSAGEPLLYFGGRYHEGLLER